MKKVLWLLAAPVAVFIIGCTTPADTKSGGGGTQVGDVAAAASTAAPAASAPTGPFTAFKAGTYDVGTAAGQVKPGKYKTSVPEGATHCYWERLSKMDGGLDDIIDNGNLNDAGTPGIMIIKASDKAVHVIGKCEWKLSA